MKKVLLVTDGIVHPPFTARIALRKALKMMQGFEFQHTNSLEKLPGSLGEFAAVVLYFHHHKISREALSGLDQFVSSGGGVLGVHTATASFKEQPDYFEILGGSFIEHGKIEPFELTPEAGSSIFADFPSFTVTDELYIHELNPGITVHFTSQYHGEEIPTIWTYRYGKGRVCYGVPGHTTKSIRNPVYQDVLRRGLQWVSGE
jgi:type 1 glutamine amidotransferase